MAATTKQPPIMGLRIVSRPESFFRAGRRFSVEPKTIPLAELAPSEIKALRAEPKLIVTEVEIDPVTDTTTIKA